MAYIQFRALYYAHDRVPYARGRTMKGIKQATALLCSAKAIRQSPFSTLKAPRRITHPPSLLLSSSYPLPFTSAPIPLSDRTESSAREAQGPLSTTLGYP